MSEVIGYLLGFFMSFVLLLTALAAFDIRAEQANTKALHVHFEDISTRVANAVLGAVDVGVQRAGAEGTAPSDYIVYYERLRIPTQIRGQDYQITLDRTEVTVTADVVTESAPLFNLQLPTPPACDHVDPVCVLSGTTRSSQGFILLKYEYNRAALPLTNQITIE
ncbi:MAG TPA: hypothetical protein VGB18_08405 [Candidatus Thermoplasmatota archaeon]